MVYEVHVLYVGYSGTCEEGMVANCSCTLIRGRKNIIVDTMTPWDKDRIIAGLARYHLTPDDITLVVCTHGHSDHIGNNNLFLNAKHIVGYSISYRDMYNSHPFEEGEPYIVDEDVKIVPTPGHTHADVTVLVRTVNLGIVAVVGDLFEKEEDLIDSSLWRVAGGSENPKSQEKYRNEMLLLADHIVPGHGPMFAVTPSMRKEADQKLSGMSGSGIRNSAPDRRPHQDRDWKSAPETEDRSNSNNIHRPSVWEGRLGPSNEWDRPRESSGKRPERVPSERLPPERLPSRREDPGARGWPDREKSEREQWDDRRRSLADPPFSPPPLLDDETTKRIEHKRTRNPSDSWDGRHARPEIDPGERSWLDRGGPDARAPLPDRFRGERRPDDIWDDRPTNRLIHEPVRVENDRMRDDRPGRFSRTDKMVERLLSQEERLRRDDRAARDSRPVRNERLPRERSLGPPENKPREADVQSIRFGGAGGGGKVRVKRTGRGRGIRRAGPTKVGDRGVPVEDKDGVRAARRDDGFRREGREPRRSGEDRIARMKDERPRREVRSRDDFHDRIIRAKHNDIGGRNGADSRTLRFHS